MQEGDFVIGINDDDVKWAPHDQVVTMIKASGNTLALKLVTPMDNLKNDAQHYNHSHKKVF